MQKLKPKSDTCIQPCNITVYEPSLSYAELSTTNIDTMVLTDNFKSKLVAQQYSYALETLQRTVQEIVWEDTTILQNIIKRGTRTMEELADMKNYTREVFMTMIEDTYFILDSDAKNIDTLYAQMVEKTQMDREFLDELLAQCFSDAYQEFRKDPLTNWFNGAETVCGK